MAEPSPYAVLGVARGCTPADIRRAYRLKAKTLHPDVSRAAGTDEAFSRLRRAYEILNDPAARARLDQEESAPRDTPDAPVTQAHYAWVNIASPGEHSAPASAGRGRRAKSAEAAQDEAFEELYLALFQTRIDAAERAKRAKA